MNEQVQFRPLLAHGGHPRPRHRRESDEWRVVRGARRQLESAAGRQRREWLRDALAGSGFPRPLSWIIEKRLKSQDFTEEQLAVEIKAARESGSEAGQGRIEPTPKGKVETA